MFLSMLMMVDSNGMLCSLRTHSYAQSYTHSHTHTMSSAHTQLHTRTVTHTLSHVHNYPRSCSHAQLQTLSYTNAQLRHVVQPARVLALVCEPEHNCSPQAIRLFSARSAAMRRKRSMQQMQHIPQNSYQRMNVRATGSSSSVQLKFSSWPHVFASRTQWFGQSITIPATAQLRLRTCLKRPPARGWRQDVCAQASARVRRLRCVRKYASAMFAATQPSITVRDVNGISYAFVIRTMGGSLRSPKKSGIHSGSIAGTILLFRFCDAEGVPMKVRRL